MRGFKGDTSPFKEKFNKNKRFIFAIDRLLLFGGNCNNDANCGSRYLNLNNDSGYSNWTYGGSPCYTP